MIQAAFYRASKGKWWDKLIAARTGSPYSHVELVLPDGTCWSASPREGRVRFKRIDLRDGKWDLLPVRLGADSHASLVESFCRHIEGARYDWPGVVSVGLSPLPGVQIGKWWWCGEAVAEALQAGGILPSLRSAEATPVVLRAALLGWNDGVAQGGGV